MNERIKELAEQAGYKPLPGFDFANSLEEIYLKKFAELIVGKCAEYAEHAKGIDVDYQMYFKELLFGEFGVEE
jgi:hypothetical protein